MQNKNNETTKLVGEEQAILDSLKGYAVRGTVKNFGLEKDELKVVQRLDAKGFLHINKLVQHKYKTGMLYPVTVTVSIVGQVA